MARMRISEVTCTYCGALLGHFKGAVTQHVRDEGGIASALGDFCDWECLALFKKDRKQAPHSVAGGRKG